MYSILSGLCVLWREGSVSVCVFNVYSSICTHIVMKYTVVIRAVISMGAMCLLSNSKIILH